MKVTAAEKSAASRFDAWARTNIVAEIGRWNELRVRTRFDFDFDASRMEYCGENQTAPRFLFLVLSPPSEEEGSTSRQRRDSVRATWGGRLQKGNLVLFFVPQDQDAADDDDDDEEQRLHGDVVRVGDVAGSDPTEVEFRLLTAALGWANDHCEAVRFIAVASDSTFVNERRFMLLAKQEQYAANRMYGAMMRKMKPYRLVILYTY